MAEDQTPERGDSDLRRRAAWLLGMLVLVAVLFVLLLVFLLHGGGDKGGGGIAHGPLDSATVRSPVGSGGPNTNAPATSPAGSNPAPSTAAPSHTRSHASKSCPSNAPCALPGDVGNAVAAINDYRTSNGQGAVGGSVSKGAKRCALTQGGNCPQGWAETQVPGVNGRTAVHKIVPFAQLLDPQLRSVDVGWAYDPGAGQYFFALVRHD